MRFYSNRELARMLKLPLARWKRWSREFLPPDPLGGLQSGFARQYNLRDAFTVFLGGHMVADLAFPVPETRAYLKQLGPWLRRHLPPLLEQSSTGRAESGEVRRFPQYHLMIIPARDLSGRRAEPSCRIRRILSRECPDAGGGLWRVEYEDQWLGKPGEDGTDPLTEKVVRLSALIELFGRSINPGPNTVEVVK